MRDRYQYSKKEGASLNTVKVSSKYQIVIPKKIRESMGLQKGTTLEIIAY